MGAMKELFYQAEQICENCIRAPKNKKGLKACGKCVINVLTTDYKGEQIIVKIKGSNKKILKVEKACKCGRNLTETDLKRGNDSCWLCRRRKAVEVKQ